MCACEPEVLVFTLMEEVNPVQLSLRRSAVYAGKYIHLNGTSRVTGLISLTAYVALRLIRSQCCC